MLHGRIDPSLPCLAPSTAASVDRTPTCYREVAGRRIPQRRGPGSAQPQGGHPALTAHQLDEVVGGGACCLGVSSLWRRVRVGSTTVQYTAGLLEAFLPLVLAVNCWCCWRWYSVQYIGGGSSSSGRSSGRGSVAGNDHDGGGDGDGSGDGGDKDHASVGTMSADFNI